MFLLILSGFVWGYVVGQLSFIFNHDIERLKDMKRKQVRIIIAVISLCIIGFFGFKAFTSKATASENDAMYSSKPKSQEPSTMNPESILSCIKWIKGDDNKNYCVIGG